MKTWTERIRDARAAGEFSADDRYASGGWVTCACGEQDPRIPRYEGNTATSYHAAGEPVDNHLHSLGIDFTNAVDENRMDDAEKILGRIETRAAVILANLQA